MRGDGAVGEEGQGGGASSGSRGASVALAGGWFSASAPPETAPFNKDSVEDAVEGSVEVMGMECWGYPEGVLLLWSLAGMSQGDYTQAFRLRRL